MYTILVIYLFIMSKYTKVGDQFRTNELSIAPGGSTVSIFYRNGQVKSYDKVKSVESYCRAVLKRENVSNILKIEVDGVLYYQN